MDLLDLVGELGGSTSSYGSLGKTAQSAINIIESAKALRVFNGILMFIFGIIVLGSLYALVGYIRMLQGRKAGLKDDIYPYIPVACTIYKLDMVGESRWKALFIGGVSSTIMTVFGLILGLSLRMGAIIAVIVNIIVIAYGIANIIFSFQYEKKLYRLFHYDSGFALFGIANRIAGMFIYVTLMMGISFISSIGSAVCVGTVLCISWLISSIYSVFLISFTFNTAFNDAVVAGDEEPSGNNYEKIPEYYPPNGNDITIMKNCDGKISCIAGMYRGADFEVDNNEIVIGRDGYSASIVITENADTISRKHCGIRYDRISGNYIVTDYSTNGTYLASGERLAKGVPQTVAPGTSIYLGNQSNRFKLGQQLGPLHDGHLHDLGVI